MKKFVLLVAVLFAVSIPAFAKKDAAWVVKKAKAEEDKFSKTSKVIFPSLHPNFMTGWKKITGQNSPGGSFFVRAGVKDGTITYMQIYYSKTNSTWGFYNSAIDQDGQNMAFRSISEDVNSSSIGVTVQEDFALDITRNYLKKYAGQNLLIKVYGKKDNFIFFLPDYYIDGILQYFANNNIN